LAVRFLGRILRRRALGAVRRARLVRGVEEKLVDLVEVLGDLLEELLHFLARIAALRRGAPAEQGGARDRGGEAESRASHLPVSSGGAPGFSVSTLSIPILALNCLNKSVSRA